MSEVEMDTIWKSIFAGVLGCLTATVLWADTMSEEGVENSEFVLYDFSHDSSVADWEVEDDVVMGGRSSGNFVISEEGHGLFTGDVSLENNGGFSSIQRYFDLIPVDMYSKAVLRVRGDGKSYQFRVESNREERHSYIYNFKTSGEWETIEVPFSEMYPQFHGNRLDLPNYPGQTMTQIRFLIANSRAESFRLEVDQILLR